MRMFACITVIVCTAVPLAAAHGQRVSGTVKDSATAAYLPGAVVVLTDSAGTTLVRTLSDAEGRYSLTAPGAGGKLRVIRIGFQPRAIVLPRASGAATAMDIWLVRIPVLLEPLDVVSRAVCSDAPDRRSAAALWEQARAGLLASVVAREARPARATIFSYDRSTELRDERVLKQRSQIQAGRTTRPFLTVDAPRLLAERGYIQEDATGRVYTAPDADVLLDDSFAETHCFGVRQADESHPGAIGLSFEPARGRESLVDVHGVLWLDARVPALRSLEFRFVGLEPAAVRAGAGGALRFQSMSNGVVFIDRWSIRMPVMEEERRPSSSTPMPGGQDALRDRSRLRHRNNFRVLQVAESGGYVLGAAWGDTLRWRTTLAPLTGRVVELNSAQPLAGVVVALVGTADTVHTDSDGKFTMAPVLPGRYSISAADTAFAAFSKQRAVLKSVLIEDGRPTEVHFELPSRRSIVARLCDDDVLPATSAILFGSLMLDSTATPSGLTVTAQWLGVFSQSGANARTVVYQSGRTSSVGDDGSFRLCGVPSGRRVNIVLTREGRQIADTALTVSVENPAASVIWSLPRPLAQPVKPRK